jgi:hypothetical protein
MGLPICDDEHNLIGENEKWININYRSNNPKSKCLSNLFPYSFMFHGNKASSIEAVLQSLKFSSWKEQKQIYGYSGSDAYAVKGCALNNWKTSQLLYYKGNEIKRESEAYFDFLDSLYFSATQNILFRNALIATETKYLFHSVGKEKTNETILTRYEFELEINCIRDFWVSIINNNHELSR